MFQNFKQAPELLLGQLNDADQAVVRERYTRMRSMVEDINQGQESQWNLRDVKLPVDTVLHEKRKATFIWALLYNLVFYPKLTSAGIVAIPLVICMQIFNVVRWVFAWIGGQNGI